MIEHIWTVLCTHAVIDGDTNNLSLFDVLEQLSLKGPKLEAGGLLPFKCELVSFWAREDPNQPAKGKARVVLITPSGKELKPHEYAIDLTTFARSRNRTIMEAVPVPEAGLFAFRTELWDEPKKTWVAQARTPLSIEHTLAE